MALKKQKQLFTKAIVHIHASYNNAIITITDENGNVIAWSSSGRMKFKGTKKSTPFAVQQATTNALNLAKERGVKEIMIQVKGFGVAKEAALRVCLASGLNIPLPHRDVTGIAFNNLYKNQTKK